MVVPSGKKVELVELVMEADCSEVKDLPDVVLGDEQEGDKVQQEGETYDQEVGDRDGKLERHQEGEGEKVRQGALGLSIEGQGALQIEEGESHHDLKDSDSHTSQHSEAEVTKVTPIPDVPLLHEVLRIPPGQSVPLAQPEDEGEELLGENEALPAQAVADPRVPDEVMLASKEPPDAGKTDSDTAHLSEPKSTDCDNFEAAAEVINNLEEGEEEEEDLILSGNFVDTISEKSREEDAASFLPPLTMNTPLKRWEVPRPLVTSTPAAAAGKCFRLKLCAMAAPLSLFKGESRLSLPPTSSSPLPPPSPDGPLSLPGLVSPGGPKSYDYLLKVFSSGDFSCDSSFRCSWWATAMLGNRKYLAVLKTELLRRHMPLPQEQHSRRPPS